MGQPSPFGNCSGVPAVRMAFATTLATAGLKVTDSSGDAPARTDVEPLWLKGNAEVDSANINRCTITVFSEPHSGKHNGR